MRAGRLAFAFLLAFALLALPLGLYTAGYFWLGTRSDVSATRLGFSNLPPKLIAVARIYPAQWQVTLFQPAGKLESWWRGVDVDIFWREMPPYHWQEMDVP